jgi:hypothetical protein
MKKLLVLIVAVSITYSGFSQDQKGKTQHHKSDSTMKKTYTCTMHPEVVSDKPGKCPKCGMNLVEKKAGYQHRDSSMHKMPMNKMRKERMDTSMHKMPMNKMHKMDSSIHKMPMNKMREKRMDTSMHKMPKDKMHKMDSSMHKMPMNKMDSTRIK